MKDIKVGVVLFNSIDDRENQFYFRLNQMLSGHHPYDAVLEKHSSILSEAISKFNLKKNVIVYGSVDVNIFKDVEIGKIVKLKLFPPIYCLLDFIIHFSPFGGVSPQTTKKPYRLFYKAFFFSFNVYLLTANPPTLWSTLAYKVIRFTMTNISDPLALGSGTYDHQISCFFTSIFYHF